LSALYGKILIVLFSGIIISFLLFALSLVLINMGLRERQIQLLNKQLEKLNTDKDRFISILAHDLRGPFSGLLGFAGLLTDNVRKTSIDEIEYQLNIINNSAKSIYILLEDILMWARNQSGKLPFEPQKLKFSTIYTEVIESLRLNANIKNIAINHFSSGELYVYADKNMVYTILRNLISNAIKFTKNGGKIDIYAETGSSEVTITVSDNGIGIESDMIAKIFDISEAHTTQGTANEEGTGLGLLLCKEFVEKHGGKIWVESKTGKGSNFKFTLQKFADTINSATNR
jgi:signal transduction histidine kinase